MKTATCLGGPSIGKLLPCDEIRAVNGEDVVNATKDHVVELVRGCPEEVRLTVCQPTTSDVSLIAVWAARVSSGANCRPT